MKGTKGGKNPSGGKQPAGTKGTTPSGQGARQPGGTASKLSFVEWKCNILLLGKNSKEAFLKKLQICMKTYDYKDETKDVRGKVTSISMFKDFTIFNLDRKIKRYQ